MYLCLNTCVEYFIQILKIDESQRMSYDHARFLLSMQLFVQKIKAQGRLVRIFVLMFRFCAGLQRENVVAFIFSN